MNELEVKARVLTQLRANSRISRQSIIASEFVLGKSSVRSDLAILSDEFIGIEIKSEKDSLRRLNSQISRYNLYFDIVLLVVASKHLKTLDYESLSQVEIWEVDNVGAIRVVQAPESRAKRDRHSLVDLLTQAEYRRFYERRNEEFDRAGSAWDSASAEMHVREAFEAAFSSRYDRTSCQFWDQVGRRKIRPSDLLNLSRYRDRREGAQRWQKERMQRWQDWANELCERPLSLRQAA